MFLLVYLLRLPDEVLKKVLSFSLNVSVAEELIPVHNDKDQSKLADLIAKKRLSIKQVRELISNHEEVCSVYDTQNSTVLAPAAGIFLKLTG